MALNLYTDSGATQLINPTEYFIGDGVTKAFTLQNITGASVTGVYKETRLSVNNVAFLNGVTTTTLSLPVEATNYIGYEVYHQTDVGSANLFRGYVTDNASGVLTISDTSYIASSDVMILVKPIKQVDVTDYSITGNTITFVGTPAGDARIYVFGTTTATLNFGGDLPAGTSVTNATKLYLKRSAGYAYYDIQISSDNLAQVTQSSLYEAATIAAGVITLDTGDTFSATNSEVGKAVNKSGVFIGNIVSNDSTTATLDDNSLTDAVGDFYTIYSVGSLEVANDNGGVAGTYRKVLQGGVDVTYGVPAAIEDDTVYTLWVRGTVPLPEDRINYVDSIIKITATEYLA